MELRDGLDWNLFDVALAVESEWKMDFDAEILWDFQKLMVSRAKFRVMIFQARNFESIHLDFERLVQAVRSLCLVKT